MSLSPPATTGITSAMVTAITTAQTALQTLTGPSGKLDNLSLAQLQNAIIAVETAYNICLAGLDSPSGINLDAIVGPSTLDGYNSFVEEVADATAESDVQLALFYLQRIIGNLTMAGG